MILYGFVMGYERITNRGGNRHLSVHELVLQHHGVYVCVSGCVVIEHKLQRGCVVNRHLSVHKLVLQHHGVYVCVSGCVVTAGNILLTRGKGRKGGEARSHLSVHELVLQH